jgi:FixJ family two-component response regulator
MNGLDLVDRLQKEGVRAPAILISGRLDTITKERAARLGITSVLEKPFAADRLVDLIRTVMSERH